MTPSFLFKTCSLVEFYLFLLFSIKGENAQIYLQSLASNIKTTQPIHSNHTSTLSGHQLTIIKSNSPQAITHGKAKR